MNGAEEHVESDHQLWSIIVPFVKQIITLFAVGGMVFGGVVPYVPQFRKIRKTRDAEGFSVYVCLVLLIANVLRVLFWFGVHYELPLLAQSLIMIVCMLVMMHICVTVKNENTTTVVHRSFWDQEYFWKWTDFRYYIQFTCLLALIGGVVTFLLLNVSIFIELLGFASLLTEAMLGIPQFWKNLKNKSTEGMSIQMVLFWTSGDTFKTIYFIIRESPLQFWLCGGIQVAVDIAILLQVALYSKTRQRLSSYTS